MESAIGGLNKKVCKKLKITFFLNRNFIQDVLYLGSSFVAPAPKRPVLFALPLLQSKDSFWCRTGDMVSEIINSNAGAIGLLWF